MSDNKQNQNINYPTLFERWLAAMIDSYAVQLFLLVFIVFAVIIYYLLVHLNDGLGGIFAVIAVITGIVLLYGYTTFSTYSYQRTIGKKLLGFKVVNSDSDKKVSLLVAIAREFLFKILFVGSFGIIAILVILVVGKNEKGQMVHDQLLKTTVIKLHDRNVNRYGCLILVGLVFTIVISVILLAVIANLLS